MTTLPTDYDTLSDMLRDHLGDEQQVIVSALMALVRLVSERRGLDSADGPEAVTQALSALEAWCRGGVEHDPLWEANLALEGILDVTREGAKMAAWYHMVGLLLGTLRVAMYEDHMDWPMEVVGQAIDSLRRGGDDEAHAVQTVASVLQRHGLL